MTAMTAAECERLIKLAEESAELAQACMKVLHHGYDGKYDNGETNRQALEREMGDVQCIIKMMVFGGDVDFDLIEEYERLKKIKVLKFTYFQQGSELKVKTDQ